MQQLQLPDRVQIHSENVWFQLTESEKKGFIQAAGLYIDMDRADIITIQNNLTLFDAFIRKAFEVIYTGRERFSARTIVEVLRWNTEIRDNSQDFKISNNITPRMSELSMEIFPSLNGLFVKHKKH